MEAKKAFFISAVFFCCLFLSAAAAFSSTITAGVGSTGGAISPGGLVAVAPNTDQTFQLTPDPDYGVTDIEVDGLSEGPAFSYTFLNVTQDHSITAFFSPCDYLYPVMLDNSDPLYDGTLYQTITGAYTDASTTLGLNSFTLKLMGDVLFEEDLIFDQDVSLVLEGGYDCSFLESLTYTQIEGSMTIADGSVAPSYLIFQAPPLCEPGDPNNFPGNQEICDGLDNDCDGVVDNGLTFDIDGDGFTSLDSCEGSADDCDDFDPNTHPGAIELCDGKDNNCDGQIDEGITPIDNDGDGYYSAESCPGSNTDCNDNDPTIHPGADEILGDHIDQDCNGFDLIFTSDYRCFDCHFVERTDSVHRRVTATDSTCINCHHDRGINVRTGHYGQTVLTAGNGMGSGDIITCTTCHNFDHDEYSEGDPNNPVWPKVLADGRGNVNCDTCHENSPAEHVTGTAHDHRLIESLCGSCHTSDTSVPGQPGNGTLETAEDVDILHGSDCTICHNYSGTLIDQATVQQAIRDGIGGMDITCLTCHGETFAMIHAFLDNHNTLVKVGTTICAECHYDPPPLVNADDPRAHTSCSSCHDENFNTISLAAGKSLGQDGDCTTCHGDYFPEHIHHDGFPPAVSYDPAVDTSQSGLQGCALCHHDYDMVNGTTVGLGSWEAISMEHDLDGTKDNSTSTCYTCHTYDGSGPTPLADVLNAITSGSPATCADCHTDKVPDVDHGVPESGRHGEHLVLAGVSCSSCHDPENIPYFKSGTDSNGDGLYNLAETNACDTCHQDGIGTPAAGFKTGWADPGFTLDCSGCHSYPPAYESGSPKANSHPAHDNFTCNTCHYTTTTTGDTITNGTNHANQVYDVQAGVGVTFDYAFAVGGGTCSSISCHGGSDAAWGASAEHDDIVTTLGTNCGACHISGALIDADDPTVHNSCASCHAANGDLRGLAAGKSAPGNCTTCHGEAVSELHAYHTATPGSDYVLVFAENQHDDVMEGDGKVYIACQICHSTELGPAHANQCATCHLSPADTLGTWTGGCQQGGCHPTKHDDVSDSHNSVVDNDNCILCHESASWSVPPANCTNCHAVYSPADSTPPVTASDALSSYIGPAVINFSISDNGKVGIGTTFYVVDSGPLQVGSRALITSAGSHTLEFWSVDQAGNVESTPNSVTFTITEDTITPVTTSNAQPAYDRPVQITLTASDNSSLGAKTTYFRINGGQIQTGNSVYIGQQPGSQSYTLEFWSDDWTGNVESPNTVNFTVIGGTGTLRLVWGDSDVTGPPGPGSEAAWTIRRGGYSGPVIASGSGSYPGWSGVDDIVVPVSFTPYHVSIDWWDDYYGFWDNTTYSNVSIETDGQLETLRY